MCLVVVMFFIRKVVLIGIIEFAAEVQWLFALSWPKYPVQRGTHIVRSLAVMLWLMDVLLIGVTCSSAAAISIITYRTGDWCSH